MPDADSLLQMMPFAAECGITIVTATASSVEGRMAWHPTRCTAGGVLHGGALMTLADTLGAACAFLNLPEGASTGTIESKTNFFRPIRSGSAVATTTPLHVGRTTIVLQTDIRDESGRRATLTTQTQAVIQTP